jgi:CRP-like cAMP-binding protein
MGQLENTPVRLIDLDLTQSKDQLTLTSKDGKKKLNLPPEDAPYIVLLQSGQVLKRIVQSLRRDLRNFRFHSFFRVLDKLCLYGFVKNESSFKDFLDESRAPYLWPGSTIKDVFLSKKIASRFSLYIAPWPLGLLLSIAITILCLPYFLQLALIDIGPGFLQSEGTYLKSLLVLYTLNSFVLSIKTLVRAVLSSLSSGWFPELRVQLSFVGIFIAGSSRDPLVRPIQQISQLAVTLASFSSMVLAIPLLNYFVGDASLRNDVLSLFIIILLSEVSPFVKSDFTKSLKLIYNLNWNSIESKWSELISRFWEKQRDRIIYIIHFTGLIVWLLLLGIQLVRILPILSDDFLLVYQSKGFQGPISVFLISFVLALLFGGLFYEIVNSFSYSGPSSGFRKFWLVRGARLGKLEQIELQSNDALTLLKEIPPFNQLEEKLVDMIAKDSDFKDYNIGHFLCEQGDDSRDMFIILSGKVGVYRKISLGRRLKVLELTSGATLGEVGFFKGGMRTADVVALENLRVLKIRFNEELNSWFLDENRFRFLQDRMWLMQTLMSSKLFGDIPLEALELFIKSGEFIDRPENQMILGEGQEPNAFYIIVQGSCLVMQKGEIIRELYRGDVFGEIGLLLNRSRTATIVSKEPVKLLVVSGGEFWHILSENINLGILLEKVAYSRIEDDYRRQAAVSS